MKDAIGDGNVLGFDITYFKPHWIIDNLISYFSEKDYEIEIYQSAVYRQEVVQYIIVNWKKTSSGALIAGTR
nr:hypothetical protein [Enterococcus sp. OL5]